VTLIIHTLEDESQALEKERFNHKGGDLDVQTTALEAILRDVLLKLLQEGGVLSTLGHFIARLELVIQILNI